MPVLASTKNIETYKYKLWQITGQVQGVGFRPFVYRTAINLNIRGSVNNNAAGVIISAWAETNQVLDIFINQIRNHKPPLAQIDSIICIDDEADYVAYPDNFKIISSSENSTSETGRITVDSAVCDECLEELFDRNNQQRHKHALINCTNCGPRYSIIKAMPYDRAVTTMAEFPMCKICESEYTDPANRRFHAQPNCCNNCGPRISILSSCGKKMDGDAFVIAAGVLTNGGILAMKGLGGYHLVVDAGNNDAVLKLRQRKKRDHKPLALMAATIQQIKKVVKFSDDTIIENILKSPAGPIVLAEIKNQTAVQKNNYGIAPAAAPGNHRLGIMLPYTPMQHLLFAQPELQGRFLVMTSANLSDDPLIIDDNEALKTLGECDNYAAIADAFLIHNRKIQRAVDDSVLLDTNKGLFPIRLGRGYTPTPVKLPVSTNGIQGLCAGGELKNAVAVVHNNSAILSQHIGDLTYSLAYQRFIETIDDLQNLYDLNISWIACDQHPNYLSRKYARKLAVEKGIQLLEIQHHHAHLASLAAEHDRTDPVIGIICDGVGYGEDGTAWGGEILIGDLLQYTRAVRLRPLRLPGGDAAAKQTSRCAISWLHDLYGSQITNHANILDNLLSDKQEQNIILAMLDNNLVCPPSSGMGRLFDAAASLLQLCDYNHYEAMSGQLLETAASMANIRPECEGLLKIRDTAIPVKYFISDKTYSLLELDHRPLLQYFLDNLNNINPQSTQSLAWLFHDAIAEGLAEAAVVISKQTRIKTVGLSGGVFCNALLTELLTNKLEQNNLEVLLHQKVPANDGGIAYGQAAIASAAVNNKHNQ